MTTLLAACMGAISLQASRPTPLAELPFVHGPGRIWLKAHLNGKPVNAVLDTGASWCLADAATASAAGGKRGVGDIDMHGIGARHIDGWPAVGLRLSLDGLDAAENVPYAAALDRAQRKGETRMDVLVGGDFLKRFAVEIDYAALRVRFYDPKGYKPPANVKPLPIRLMDDRPVADLPLRLPGDDERTVSAQLDTGATGITLTGALVRRERLIERFPEAKVTVNSGGLGGRAPGRALNGLVGYLAGLVFFGTASLDITKGGATGPDAMYDALLGDDVWPNRLLILDYTRSTLYLS